jgi:uncharacterized membrane protein
MDLEGRTQDEPARPMGVSKLGRLARAGAISVAAGIVTGLFAPWQAVPLLVWVSAAAVWLGFTWFGVAGLDSDDTRRLATTEDPHGPTADAMLITASVASLGAVILGVLKAANAHGSTKVLLLTAGVGAIIGAWGVVHTVFTLRYAALYYLDPGGAVDFNEDGPPTYADFAYLAFTIGMTYQVSDTNLKTKAVRHTALRHGLLSYLFGTVIIATTINIAAGLAH